MRLRISAAIVACTAVAAGWPAGPVLAAGAGPASLRAGGSGSGWSVQTRAAVPGPSRARLYSVSCWASTDCVAAGWTKKADGRTVPLAVVASGGSWTAQTVPLPAGHTQGSLASVSCVSGGSCYAVGESASAPLVEKRSAAGAWSVIAVPPLPAAGGLSSVSCASARRCVAVGGESSEVWDGSGWQVVALATPTVTSGKRFTALGVSCPATAGCIAVGDSADAGFAERWDGTAWSNLPAIPKSQPVSGISCSSVSQCTAVGAQAYRWNGSTWALQKLPGGGYVSWTGVSCPTSSTCLAVGAWSPNKNTYVYAAQWSDGKWKDAGAPVDIGHLQGVSCPAPSACTVVGARGSGAPYAAQGSPASLKPQKVPAPPGPPSSQTLLGVSCAHSGSCVLVGSGDVGNKGTRGIAEEFTGKSWARLPAPPTGKGGWLTAVSCVSAADCEAVGYDDHTPLFGVHWDGQKWSRVTIPNRPYVVLSAISCVSASSCEAVGYYARPKNLQYVPFAVGWNGTAWTVQPVPSPSARSNTELASVSCASATECMAVGSAGNQEQGHSKAFAELWDGKSWTLQTLPKAPAGNGALSAVACPSPAMCLAAGGAGKNSLGESAVTLVEQWKAGAWTVLSTPSPFQIGFNGLSCPSTTDCTAVGGDSLTTPPFAEAWKGSAWQVQKVPGSTQLNSVSCTSAHYCEAAGTNYLGRNVVAGYRN